MATQNVASYADCVDSLRTSLVHLESSVNILGNGVADHPRLKQVLKTVRVSLDLLGRAQPFTVSKCTDGTPAMHNKARAGRRDLLRC